MTEPQKEGLANCSLWCPYNPKPQLTKTEVIHLAIASMIGNIPKFFMLKMFDILS
jgi:hypothetical protein